MTDSSQVCYKISDQRFVLPDQCIFASSTPESSAHGAKPTVTLTSLECPNSVDRLKSKHLRQQGIVNLLKKYDEEVYPTGERLPDKIRVYRIKVLSSILKAVSVTSLVENIYLFNIKIICL